MKTLSRSSLIWVCTVCPDISFRKLRIITVDMFHKSYNEHFSKRLRVESLVKGVIITNKKSKGQ